jgi:hypothetical protein
MATDAAAARPLIFIRKENPMSKKTSKLTDNQTWLLLEMVKASAVANGALGPAPGDLKPLAKHMNTPVRELDQLFNEGYLTAKALDEVYSGPLVESATFGEVGADVLFFRVTHAYALSEKGWDWIYREIARVMSKTDILKELEAFKKFIKEQGGPND